MRLWTCLEYLYFYLSCMLHLSVLRFNKFRGPRLLSLQVRMPLCALPLSFLISPYIFFVRESFCFFLLISIEFLWFFFCQVLSQWLVDQAPLGHKAPLPGEGGPRDRLEWCPACRGLLQAPIPMSSRHACFYLFLFPSFNGFIQACFGGLYGSGSL